jgi:hypothetical protein
MGWTVHTACMGDRKNDKRRRENIKTCTVGNLVKNWSLVRIIYELLKAQW